MNTFSTFEAAKILKIDITRFHEWLKREYIPLGEGQKAKGRGTKTAFYDDDLYRIKTFEILIGVGIKREFASDYIKYLHGSNRKKPKDFNWEKYYLKYEKSSDGRVEMGLETERDKGKDYLKNSLIQLTINLKEIKKSVDKNIQDNKDV
jgi:hypothetical protein